jgi:hypothetical protein
LKRGVVLEVNRQFVTLLTHEGEFLKSRKVKEHYSVGEEVDFFPVNEHSTAKKSFFRLEKMRVGIASSIAAVLLFFTLFTFYDSQEVYAYMSIDINPSLEAGVDKKLRVISLEAFNDEGEIVLNNLEEWINQPIDSVTESIIQESKDSGYYQEGAEVLIATVIVEDEGDTLEESLNSNVEDLVQSYQKESIPVVVLNSTVHDREAAIENGLSTGKYVKEKMMASEKEAEKDKIKTMDKGKDDERKSDATKNEKKKDNSSKMEEEIKGPKDKNGDLGPASQKNNGNGKDKGKIKVEMKNNFDIEIDLDKINRGKDQEDKKGPPEAVKETNMNAKEKREEKKGDKTKGKDDNNDKNNRHDD